MYRLIGLNREQIRNAVKSPPKLRAKMQGGERPTLWIYHDIGDQYAEQSTEDIVKWIASQSRRTRILVRINSYGGYFHDGIAIYNALREHGHAITRVDGVAASAAAIIALAGRPVQIAKGASLFVHRAYAAAVGNAKVFSEMAQTLEKFDEDIARVIAAKAGTTVEQAFAWLDGDVDGTWFNSEEALAWNLADVVLNQDESEEEQEEEEQEQEDEQPTGDATEDEETKKTTSAMRRDVVMNFVPDNPSGGEGEGVEGDWTKPTLADFTDEPWEELDDAERRKIASYFAFAISLDSFGDLKLPHHFPPNHANHPKASLAAVRNALARLSQTEEISEEDRQRIEAHLRAHMPEEDSARGREHVRLQILKALHEKLKKGAEHESDSRR